MARAGHSGTVVGSAVVVREKYYWPDLQLNIWTIVMLATAGLILGVNAQFMAIQSQMGLGTPWYVTIHHFLHLPPPPSFVFRIAYSQIPSRNVLELRSTNPPSQSRIMPYGVTVGALAIFFILIEIVFIAQRRLLPGTMMLLSFILLVLFIAGIIGTAIQLFAGPNINNQCNTYVFNAEYGGANRDTLAWLQQRNICEFSCFLAILRWGLVRGIGGVECGDGQRGAREIFENVC